MKCELGKKVHSNKVTKIKCKVCIKYEQNIIGMKGFSKSWINSTVSVKKHAKGDPHLHDVDLEEKKNLWQIFTIRGGFFFANRKGISKND